MKESCVVRSEKKNLYRRMNVLHGAFEVPFEFLKKCSRIGIKMKIRDDLELCCISVIYIAVEF